MPIRDERSLDDGVLAGGCPHAQRVPGLDYPVARGIAGHDGMHDLRVIGVGDVEPIDLEPVPDRRQRAEMLVPEEAIAAIDPLRPAGSVKHLEVVARFRITVCEYRAAGGFL